MSVQRRYLQYVTVARPIAPLAVFAVLGATIALAAPTFAASAPPAAPSSSGAPAASVPPLKIAAPPPAILHSPQLWATVDVCNPTDQPDTVGVRGSMPGDEHPKDAMYMRFRLQYLDSSTKHWADLANGADSGFVAVGAAKSARQAGFSFQLTPVAGKPAFMLRGVVSFEWRRGATVEYAISRPTTARHKSVSGADPAGFSAAACSVP